MSSLIRTDVTAVKLYRGHIIAGIGSTIHVYKKKNSELVVIHNKVLEGQKIYGIVPLDDEVKLIIFGGKQFRVINRLIWEADALDCCLTPVVCDDWLHSAIWISDDTIALLTAHNIVQTWSVSDKQHTMIKCTSGVDNSILYSGLLLPLEDDVLVFSGTVFSEVMVYRCDHVAPLHCLTGHKGVIFSICCSQQRDIVVTTSDDRSVRIWRVENASNGPTNTAHYWDATQIFCLYELYGHSARVMRSCIGDNFVVSVGEDSGVCFWSLQGKLKRKIVAHQNAPIWCADADSEHLVTGGGDCGVSLHPLSVATDYGRSELLSANVGVPKRVVFTARRNVVVLNEKDHLVYYDVHGKHETVHKLNHESTYKMLSVSSCKQIIAVADMIGNLDVFVENCRGSPRMTRVVNTKLNLGNFLSMHWAGNRHLVFCSDNGDINVVASRDNETEVTSSFTLPACKERWLTAAAMSVDAKLLVVGDRCGSVHIYRKGCRAPIKTFNKVHGRYGPTSVTVKDNDIYTTGRDRSVKYFISVVDKDGGYRFKYLSSKDVEFQWVERFVDNDHNIICGFQERVFVVTDVSANSKLLEVPCGGGHRSWDVVRYVGEADDRFEDFVKLIYVKNSDINLATFRLIDVATRCVVRGSHSKEINCLKSHVCWLGEPYTFYISGGEDTALRVSRIEKQLTVQDEVVFKHLSNIRTLKTVQLASDKCLVVSGGGRAQICVNLIHFRKERDGIKIVMENLIDFLIKGTDKERKGDLTWRDCTVDFDPETRIMDLEVTTDDFINFTVYTGCSDAYVRIFGFEYNEECKSFKLLQQFKYHKTCILKTHLVVIANKTVLVTGTTRGEVTFWDVTGPEISPEPFFATTTNKSGVNCIAARVVSASRLLVATGGDDNAIHTIVLEVAHGDLNTVRVVHAWSSDQHHSSQITGVVFVNEAMVTAGVDQRVTVFVARGDGRGWECLHQRLTDVADVHGLELVTASEECTVCVYGKGMEIMTLPLPA